MEEIPGVVVAVVLLSGFVYSVLTVPLANAMVLRDSAITRANNNAVIFFVIFMFVLLLLVFLLISSAQGTP